MQYVITIRRRLATTCLTKSGHALGYSARYECHDVPWLVSHELRHALRMSRINVAIGVENQFSTVFVTLPLSNNLHIYSFLNCAGNEHTAKRALAKWC